MLIRSFLLFHGEQKSLLEVKFIFLYRRGRHGIFIYAILKGFNQAVFRGKPLTISCL